MRGRCADPVSGHAPLQILNERAGFKRQCHAARSLQEQAMAMHGAAGIASGRPLGVKNEKARNLAVSGPLLEIAWKVRAYALPPPGGT